MEQDPTQTAEYQQFLAWQKQQAAANAPVVDPIEADPHVMLYSPDASAYRLVPLSSIVPK